MFARDVLVQDAPEGDAELWVPFPATLQGLNGWSRVVRLEVLHRHPEKRRHRRKDVIRRVPPAVLDIRQERRRTTQLTSKLTKRPIPLFP